VISKSNYIVNIGRILISLKDLGVGIPKEKKTINVVKRCWKYTMRTMPHPTFQYKMKHRKAKVEKKKKR